jgi:hypothetical protein
MRVRCRRWIVYVAALIGAVTFAGAAFAQAATGTPPPAASDPTDWFKYFPTPTEWQGYCIVFGPLFIAAVIRFINTERRKTHRALLDTHARKWITNATVLAAAVVGLALDHKLDNFTPTFAGLLYMVSLVHQSYDKLWMGVPGLSHLIKAIDPEASA